MRNLSRNSLGKTSPLNVTRRQEPFDKLKTIVTSVPILKYPNLQQPLRVEADASKYALGGVLLQDHDKEWMPIAFQSTALKPAERNYVAFKKELLALIDCMRVWSQYLRGQKFNVYSDHQTLQHFFTQTKVKGRHMRLLRERRN